MNTEQPTSAATTKKPCPRCRGCGQLANSTDREPWTDWTSLPAQSQLAIRMGLVAPEDCDECGGSGSVPAAVSPVADAGHLHHCEPQGASLHGWTCYAAGECVGRTTRTCPDHRHGPQVSEPYRGLNRALGSPVADKGADDAR